MGPVSSLLLKSRCVRLVIRPSSGGMGPVSSLLLKSRCVRLAIRPGSAGMGSVSSSLLEFMYVGLPMIEIQMGIFPVSPSPVKLTFPDPPGAVASNASVNRRISVGFSPLTEMPPWNSGGIEGIVTGIGQLGPLRCSILSRKFCITPRGAQRPSFSSKLSALRSANSTRLGGSSPVNWLPLNLKFESCTKPPISGGTVPVRRLFSKSSVARLVRRASSVGGEPLKPLLPKSK